MAKTEGGAEPKVASPERVAAFRTGISAESRAAALLIAKGFRILARRYHPDCHPDKDEAATTELSRSFAALAENYRCLKAVGESVGLIRH